MAGYTAIEQRIDRAAHALIDRAELGGMRAGLVEFAVFVAKQAWACVFGFLLLAIIVAARLWYPEDALLARNDALTLAAVAIQVLMLATRLETIGELRVVLLFHVAGTVMELFKTAAGSWQYDPDGMLRIGAVPLFSGFMYAAVGSYMVRVYRLFDLRFDRYPRRWVTALIAGGVYVNFFAHHVLPDIRWALIAIVLVAWWPTMMRARVLRTSIDLPILLPFAGVAVVIWMAENVSTWAGAWSYPDQVDGWAPVSIAKLGSWFLLMIVSVVLVTWVYPPRSSVVDAGEDPDEGGSRPVGSSSSGRARWSRRRR
ncbi:MAG: DUF817 domain-containing protein [Protaetiibacter sp.]